MQISAVLSARSGLLARNPIEEPTERRLLIISSQAVKSATTNEKDVAGVNLQHLLMGVLASALGRDVGDAALNYLEEFLLDAFAGNIAGDGAVDAFFAGDFVQLINVDDALFGAGNVPIGGLNEAEQDVFHILTDVTRLSEGRGVADGEGDVQGARQGFRRAGFLPEPVGPISRILDFWTSTSEEPASLRMRLKWVIDSDGEGFFGPFLSDYVGVETGVDFTGHQSSSWIWRIPRGLFPSVQRGRSFSEHVGPFSSEHAVCRRGRLHRQQVHGCSRSRCRHGSGRGDA